MSANVSFSCSDIYNVSGSTYAVEQEDGGIPENLGLNFAIWLVRRPWWRLPLCLAKHFRVVVFFIYIYIYIFSCFLVFFFLSRFWPAVFRCTCYDFGHAWVGRRCQCQFVYFISQWLIVCNCLMLPYVAGREIDYFSIDMKYKYVHEPRTAFLGVYVTLDCTS